MFIVKLILVPFWPIFLTNWLKEKVPGGVTFKSYMATLAIIYALFILGAIEIWGKIKNSDDQNRTPPAQTAEQVPAATSGNSTTDAK